MQHASAKTEDGKIITVTADGKSLGNADVDQRVVHILPKLFIPASLLNHIKIDDIGLTVVSSLSKDISPEGGAVIRQPYPNRRYFVGGSATLRNGWVVPISEEVTEFDIEFQWEIDIGNFDFMWKLGNVVRWAETDTWFIRHRIHVTLLPGEARTYSFDASCWPRVGGEWSGRTAVSLLGHEEDDDSMKEGRNITSVRTLVAADEPDIVLGQQIEERLDIPPICYEQAWSINAFQDEQLHEVKQQSEFSKLTEEHQKNASVEMPASILLEAIKLAESIPYDKESDFQRSIAGRAGGMEEHPAMVLMNQWWEDHRVDGRAMKSGSAMPWVRVRDDGEYWCGHYEVPNMAITAFAECAPSAARVGDVILILFQASHQHFTYSPAGTEIYLADGQPYYTVGIDQEDVASGKYDEAWYALNALSSFRRRFPAAYKALTK